ncbi:MAG TPA: branched-chain amino acid ABC transporter permease, partial [Burkholderiales bacterium]|nr:branched-chain amino acid ABC transporter permease [Burkholderiales bacterium]
MDALANNLQVLFQGLALGSIYALVALGFVLIIRATNVVNFAQGDFAMLGAYIMVAFLIGLGMPYWLSFALALIGMGVFGLIFNYGVYFPLRNRGFLPVIISTLGASIFLQNTVLAIFGA